MGCQPLCVGSHVQEDQMTHKPYKVKAKICREVEEIVILCLDEEGMITYIEGVLEELTWDLTQPIEIQEVQSTHEEAPWTKQ